jgi:hypothetical protein
MVASRSLSRELATGHTNGRGALLPRTGWSMDGLTELVHSPRPAELAGRGR